MQTSIINDSKTEKQVVFLFSIWGIAAYLIGKTKLYVNLPRQLFGLTVFFLITTLLVVYLKNKSFNQLANRVPLKYLALFHSWRIFAGLLFFAFENTLPLTFVNEAGYGDIISGFLGILVFIFFQNKIGYYVFNIIGLVDLAIALGLGMTYALTGDPKMAGIVELPLIIIPLFGVPILAFTHIISFSKLIKESKNKSAS